jgi:hypothetical protein
MKAYVEHGVNLHTFPALARSTCILSQGTFGKLEAVDWEYSRDILDIVLST